VRPVTASDDVELAASGYRPSLERSVGRFGSFAAGVSYISVLTGTFQLFYFGFGSGGPAYWWSWPLVFAGQLMVALCFAELAARYPFAGSVYHWSKRLGSDTTSWLAGWTMLIASVVTLSAVVLAYQLTLPQLWSGFQLVGDGTGTYDSAVNAVVLGSALVLFTTVVNAYGVRLMSRINSVGVFVELVAAVLLVVLLAVNLRRGPAALLETAGTGEGRSSGYLGAFLVAALASGYVMYGFDTASSLGEETRDPRRTAPRAILTALVASFLLGGAILLLAVLSVPDLGDERLGLASGGLQLVVLQVLGGTLGKVFLACVVLAITVCALAVHAATIRLAFTMARDGTLPASAALARVDPVHRTPVVPAVVVGVLAVAILLVNVRQPQIFTVVTSIAIVLIYVAYLLVTGPMLLARLRGTWPPPAAPGAFSLGRLGLPVNVAAVLWGTAMAVNLGWPRAEVYDAVEPHRWYLQWFAPLAVGTVLLGGLALYRGRLRARAGVLPEHLAEPQPAL
jgi:urea carboxylase system permease